MMLAEAVAAVVTIGERGSEQGVLERLVDVARRLTSARYGVALLLGTDGRPSSMAHQGMTSGQVAVLPRLPRPVGLLAVVLRGETVRLEDLHRHPESLGFPAGHVPMAALLGVPVTVGGRVLGALYLTQAPGDGCFTEADELLVVAAARQAGSAVEALRQRAAHEALIEGLGPDSSRAGDAPTGDGDSPVVRRLLATAREVLGVDLTFLARLEDGRQTFEQVDRASGLLGLDLPEGTEADASEGYCSRMLAGDVPAAVPDVAAHPVLGPMAVTAELGAGSYCGVAVHLPDGSLYGTLCGLDRSAGAAPSGGQLEALRILARLVGARLAREHAEQARRAAAVAELAPLVDGRLRTTVLQPIVELDTGRAVGFEALSRFREESGAARRPDEVFALALQLGVGLALEQAAARSALALLPQLPDDTYLSVNLSPQAVLDPASYDLLSAALAGGGAGRVVLELTEHERVPDYPGLLLVLERLRGQGLRLAVDDAGSGFASLQHVTRLRPEVIKLDIAFVRELHLDPARRAVARAMAGFAADLGATLVAEGVETVAELDQLLLLGVPLGQGYHFAAPAPPAVALSRTGSTRRQAESARRPVRELVAVQRPGSG